MEIKMQDNKIIISGQGGSLSLSDQDEYAWKFLMLIEGECGLESTTDVAKRFGYSKQRYYQLRRGFLDHGSVMLCSQKRGPKGNYRRAGEVTRQVIRYRYLDPDASVEVIAQKLRQDSWTISNRSVYRIFEDFGLQKKGSTGVGQKQKAKIL